MDSSIIAENLHLWMELKNREAKELSLAAGLGETYIGDILRGRSVNPRSGQLQKVADQLGCGLPDLTTKGVRERVEFVALFSALNRENQTDAISYLKKLKRLQDLDSE